MKEKMPSFAFTRGEVATVRALSNHRNPTVQELARIMGTSESSVSQRVKNLKAKGIVKAERKGMRKYVSILDGNYAISLLEMVKAEPYVPWENLISNSSLSVLFGIAGWEESRHNIISPASSFRALRELSMHGMVTRGKDGLSIKDKRLSRFINDYSEYVSRKFLMDELPPDAVILWRNGHRALFRINDNADRDIESMPKGALPAAVTIFPEYGIRIMTQDSYYYYGDNTDVLSVEDTILQTLLIDPDSQTYATYALLLTYKIKEELNLNLLRSKARRYKIGEKTENLIRYVESHGKDRKWPLPVLGELQEQAESYGIVVN